MRENKIVTRLMDAATRGADALMKECRTLKTEDDGCVLKPRLVRCRPYIGACRLSATPIAGVREFERSGTMVIRVQKAELDRLVHSGYTDAPYTELRLDVEARRAPDGKILWAAFNDCEIKGTLPGGLVIVHQKKYTGHTKE